MHYVYKYKSLTKSLTFSLSPSKSSKNSLKTLDINHPQDHFLYEKLREEI